MPERQGCEKSRAAKKGHARIDAREAWEKEEAPKTTEHEELWEKTICAILIREKMSIIYELTKISITYYYKCNITKKAGTEEERGWEPLCAKPAAQSLSILKATK